MFVKGIEILNFAKFLDVDKISEEYENATVQGTNVNVSVAISGGKKKHMPVGEQDKTVLGHTKIITGDCYSFGRALAKTQ